MSASTVTIRLDAAMRAQLESIANRTEKSRTDLARELLRRQLALMQFEEARSLILPFARTRGYLTDEDVFERLGPAQP